MGITFSWNRNNRIIMNIPKIYKSKRFTAFSISTILFIIMTYTTQYTPMELSGALSILTGVYIGAETIKKSHNLSNIE